MSFRSKFRTVAAVGARRSTRALLAATLAIGALAATASTGSAMRGDAMRGDAMRGDAVRGDAVRGDAVRGDAVRGDARRHLRLLRGSPAADTTLAASPDAIRLWLSEPTEAPGSKIALANAAGAAVTLQPISRDAAKDAPLVAKVAAPLPPGAYKVTWKAMSRDGHVVNGTYGFTVGAAK